MKKPTHEEISERAHRLWLESGSSGNDATQNWLDAERELTAAHSEPPSNGVAAEHVATATLSETQSAHAATERSSQQRKEARAPKVAKHTGPKPATPETGKPLWKQPHSS